MWPLGYHIRTRLKDGRVIADCAAARRVVANVVLDLGRDHGLFVFALPGKHLHLGARCTEAAAGELCRRIEISLQRRLDLKVGFQMYPHESIRDQRHLEYVVRYILTQDDHHRIRGDPFREGTNLPDLLGMRMTGRYTRERLARWTPELTDEALLEWIHLPTLRPAEGPLERLLPAALRATALPDLRGSSRRTVATRRAIIEVVGKRLRIADVATLLGVSRSSIHYVKSRPADPVLVRAIRLQLGAEALLADRNARLRIG